MDDTQRKITKIAREAAKFTVQTMKAEGIGTAEFDFIHLVRHKPGITQAEIRETLKIDKGAAARRAASLEAKGYLVRKPNPEDKRSQLLFATEKAEELKTPRQTLKTLFMTGSLLISQKQTAGNSAASWISFTGNPKKNGEQTLPMYRHGPMKNFPGSPAKK